MTYLVDSDWVIDALSGLPSALAPLRAHAPNGLSVSVVTLGEVFEGAYGFPNPERHLAGMRRFLAGFAVLGLSEPIMDRFARTRYALRRQGNVIPDLDLLIGSTAVQYRLILMTRNLRHFTRIPGLQIYSSS